MEGAGSGLAVPPAHPRRIVFLGTPDVAVPALEALVDGGFDVALAVTRADKRRGRGSALMPSPVKAAAERLGIPVAHRVDAALDAGADVGVVVAFGQLVRRHVLERMPMVNLHFSKLPRWRGAAPVERALLAGDDATAVCLMQLEEDLDTGPVYACTEVPIGPRATAAELRRELAARGSDLLVRQLRHGLVDPAPQSGPVSYAAKLSPEELRIDWARPAVDVDRLVRVGGAWTTFRGKRLKVPAVEPVAVSGGRPGQLDGLLVPCGEGTVRLLSVQPEGRAAMTADAWRNGARPRPGEALGR